MAQNSKKVTTSKRKKANTTKKRRKLTRNQKWFLDELLFPYGPTEYDCQLCENYDGHNDDGSIRCLLKTCNMLKEFDDFTTNKEDDNDKNKSEENDDYDDWDYENDDLAGLFIC